MNYMIMSKVYEKKQFDGHELVLYKAVDNSYNVKWESMCFGFNTLKEARRYYENFGR